MGHNLHHTPKCTYTRIQFACISTPDIEYSAILHKKRFNKTILHIVISPDRISRYIYKLGLHEGNNLLDEKTRFNVILKALNAGIQTIGEQRQDKGQCPVCDAELGCAHRAGPM